ncbi:1-acyl-sn-glycerol-3-phosphate acyltransferase alpha-like [Toxorhynchites rutilus septentrionalis]|uniref:1-acyl-sn-glycerol-3-phosphate acyltransferase alpha-like n=1 Tax=Toxorhynchites rutilus septentrionalis TaxID=329112 RepID=UPI00247AC1B7|nr:1-acyl-sn-glycerol-3-phosphate acyltransferase alpha-like [Toxorhynchites rutilus septentrionalis]
MEAIINIVKDVFLNSLCVQLIVATILLSCVWPTFKYYAKLTVIIIVSCMVLVIPIPFFLIKPRWPLNALVSGKVTIEFVRWLGVSYEVRGTEHINVRNGGVALINHQSAIDIVLLARLLADFRNIVPVVKKELFYLLPFGIGSYLVGVVFIDRKNTTSAKNVMKRESVAIMRDNLKLAIFPEGTRHDNDTLLPFKKGSFHVAIDTQSVIQPVVVSKYVFIDHKKKRFGRGRVIVQILPEISTQGKTKDDINELVEQCQKLMQTEFDALSAEAKQYCRL